MLFILLLRNMKRMTIFLEVFSTFSFIELVLGVLLLISEKFSPKKYHIIIFKTFSALFGVFMLGLIVLLWILFSE